MTRLDKAQLAAALRNTVGGRRANGEAVGLPWPPDLTRSGGGDILDAATKKTVLLVDDDATVLVIAGTTIEALGFFVIRASSAEEAWDHYRLNQIDVLITDIVLPNEDGLSLAHRIMQNQAGRLGKPIPIITISGETKEQVAAKSLAALGGTLHLQKPVQWTKLAALVGLLCPREKNWPGAPLQPHAA